VAQDLHHIDPEPLPEPTARLEFRPWYWDDLPDADELWGDPEVTRFTSDHPLDDVEVAARLAREIDDQLTYGLSYWVIEERDSYEFRGCCGLHQRMEEPAVPELGFHLVREVWGQGLAREAAESVIRFAWEKLHVPALFAGHHPDNTASAALLKKLGFVRTHEELYPPTGRMHPSYRLENPNLAVEISPS
jgi:RimJ/RimL family protein N-acetyltransferase